MAVDQLFVGALQHRERDLEIAHDRDFVVVAAGRGVGGKAGARPPVGAQNVVEKERRNVGEAGPEERGEVGGRFATVDALLEGESHRRIG